MSAQVNEIHIFPVQGAPGRELPASLVEDDGLEGDRRKKAAVQVVAAQDVRADTRANLVVSLGSDELAASIGKVLRVGAVELDVTGTARNCPGVYAAVRRPGTVRVGDDVEVVS
ncbi:uncharacterized protein YcbX [Phycicoccus badiiscoriae]|uniref:Uncharacterized protein YcbX n=1 Tax=Pedococcus badiiscoriae TaxID=642776 RepID=A0A852WI08_9MICO|nr:hypothetical protein [Pedococcus badiiscoriae]NYG08608.1 uncharacterized protein YcbX [Pedococcus badiiscoriae]